MTEHSTSNNTKKAGKSKSSALWRFVRFLLMATAAGYSLLLIYLVANETKLVYPAQKYPIGDWHPKGLDFQEVYFNSLDGTKLAGWFIPRFKPDRTILVFHGNAENVATTSRNYAFELAELLNAEVLVFDYRGYGLSEGTPDEKGVIEDGIAALRWLENRTGKPSSGIIFYGSSIGGGVAVAVAERENAKILVLDRTFGSLTEPAQEAYPWVPVTLLMRNRFPSAERIKNCAMPVYISHFANDDLIPIASARKLYLAAPTSEKEFFEMPGDNHLSALPKEYWPKLIEVIERFERSSGSDKQSNSAAENQ